MAKLSLKYSLLFSFIFHLFICTPSLSTLVADIDIVEFPHTVQRKHVYMGSTQGDHQHLYDQTNKIQQLRFEKYVRIAFFDVELQEFIGQSIFYLPILPQSGSISFTNWFTVDILYGSVAKILLS